MPTVEDRMAEVREILHAGNSPQPRAAAFVQALASEEVLLHPEAGKTGQLPWETRVFNYQEELQKAERRRIERLTALQELVTDSSPIFEVVKNERNPAPSICIGRAKRNDIILPDSAVSSLHAQIESDFQDTEERAEQHFLTDLNSSNGTYVNKVRLEPSMRVELRSGDCVRFGRPVFYYLTASRLIQFLELRLVKTSSY